jgi:hypothetical protein
MTTTTAFPLCWPAEWPRTDGYNRRAGTFKNCTMARSRDRLFTELTRIRATDVILSTNVPLKLDGEPRGDWRQPGDPGVAVYFHLRKKPLAMARDAYIRVEHNLNSLAMAIEFLRGLERHGGSTMMERAFTGFAALPDPNRAVHWRDVLMLPADGPVFAAHIELAFKALARERHPDVGGSDVMMAELNRAREEGLKEIADRI